MRYLFAALVLLGFCGSVDAQIIGRLPKREFRGAWVATVSNIDWPSRQGRPAEQQQQEAIRTLDSLRAMGCNAVILQVRPAADAFYESSYEPWSRFLTGHQGVAPSPYYDPLRFWTQEAHRRNMEMHAWFNPFRALTDSKKNPNPPTHVTKTHPEWIISYGGKSYIDPGIPAARNYVVSVIAECARRYDIDAVHLDDYFYPYKVPGKEFGDAGSYRQWGGSYADKGDWRRANVNAFIQQLHDSLRAAKSWMKLGISPFGIWRSRARDSARGSDTRPSTTTNYDDLFADVLLWQERGWIDYMMPQLYWEHGHKSAPFEVLLPWWDKWRYGRHVYYGLGLYRMNDAKVAPAWRTPDELLSQIRDIRSLGSPTGYALYSASIFDKIPHRLADSLEQVYAPTIALPPTMPWLDTTTPGTPTAVRVSKAVDGALVEWVAPRNPNGEPLRYAVYRFAEGEQPNIERAERLAAVTTEPRWIDPTGVRSGHVYYVVTALDRLWNESRPTAPVLRP
jgi:uncharacterized lipoprotein YddW (UPF0748 family)